MKSRLKSLYTYLIKNRIHEINGWYNSYQEFHSQVNEIRKRLKDGDELSTFAEEEDGKAFLQRLLYDESNGIASRGQSTLSKVNFEKYIKDSTFIFKLESFIKDPQLDTFSAFEKSWFDTAQKHGAKNNTLLINRVAAACTLSVSTTSDASKFKQVFNWLIKEEIISEYPVEKDQSWFSKNLFLLEFIKNEFDEELSKKKTDEFLLNIFIWCIYENLSNPFSLKKQIIKYGAPGTGKTYQACQQTSLLFEIWKNEFAPKSSMTDESQIELVQFHPSFSYEDFIEGLRPVLDDTGTAQLTLQNGIFKEFCLRAGKWEIEVNELSLDWKSLTIEKILPYKEQLSGDHWQSIFETTPRSKLVSEAVPPFFFIIDEVNRAELSRVFGELMYCLEYRGVKGAVKTQYANLNSSNTGMLCINNGLSEKTYKFFIPTNVYFIGTMNTVDRSVESFDFALRRRFRWEEVMPDIGLLKYHLPDGWKKLATNLEKLNRNILKQPLLGRDYQIGHAYLMNMNYSSSLSITEVRSQIWDDSIRPLLQEYLRGTGSEVELMNSFRKDFGL